MLPAYFLLLSLMVCSVTCHFVQKLLSATLKKHERRLRNLLCLQLDDPLDAIAVHAWNGTWGVVAVGFFASQGLIDQSYGPDPYTGELREYGCFLGGNGRLLGAQLIYALWLGGKHLLHLREPEMAQPLEQNAAKNP